MCLLLRHIRIFTSNKSHDYFWCRKCIAAATKGYFGLLTSYGVPAQNCFISRRLAATAADVMRVKGTK